MCGIAGLVTAGKYSSSYDDAFRDLLYMSALRGQDSTGVAVIRPKDYILRKKAYSAIDFIQSRDWGAVRSAISANSVVIGHARAATRGSVSHKNAHPFETDNLILVHNGSINNHYALDSGVTSDVDSEHIAFAMEKHGEQATLDKINGPAVLVWYNFKDTTFNIARTQGRNLHWILDESGSLWFASEWEAIFAATARHDIKLTKEILFPPENHWFTWSMNSAKDLSKYETKKITPKTYSSYGGGHGHRPFAEGGLPAPKWTSKSGNSVGTGGTASTRLALHETTNTSTIKKINDKLRPWKLKVGDKVVMRPTQFYKYDGVKMKDLGAMWGYLDTKKGKNLRVCIPGVDNDEFAFAHECYRADKKSYLIQIVNVATTDKKELYVVGKCIDLMSKLESLQPSDEDIDTSKWMCGPANQLIPRESWDRWVAAGCSLCQNKIELEDHENIEWIGEDNKELPLCVNCSISWNQSDRAL
jgi:predicted glutamine amidotransferase